MEACVVLITTPAGDTAVRIARDIVENRLGACVNIVKEVRSLYHWQGAIQDDMEDLLIIKTARDRVRMLIERVREIHPYTVPEIIALPIVEGSESYLEWVFRETHKT